MDHLSLLLFTCVFSVIFAGTLWFNYLSRGKSRSLRHVWGVLVCWPLLVACYGLSCWRPALVGPMHILCGLLSVTGLAGSLKINLEQQQHDLEKASKEDSGSVSG